jgi:hypothetical protein
MAGGQQWMNTTPLVDAVGAPDIAHLHTLDRNVFPKRCRPVQVRTRTLLPMVTV